MKSPINANASLLNKMLLAILVIPVLLILYLVGLYVVSPILDSIEKGQFEKLDTQQRGIYDIVNAASNGAKD
jgi:nitrogen fixation-related uncharacterized protein